MGNVSSKDSAESSTSSSSSSSPSSSPSSTSPPSLTSSPRPGFISTGGEISSTQQTTPARSSFSIVRSTKTDQHSHKRSHSHSVRPTTSRSQNSDSGNSTGKSQNELVSDTSINTSKSETDTNIPEQEGTSGTNNLKTAHAAEKSSRTNPASAQFNKPLPKAPAFQDRDILPHHSRSSISTRSTSSTTQLSFGDNRYRHGISTEMIRTNSISQQSTHSQSSLSVKSTISNGSSGSGGSIRSATTPSTSVTGGTTESLGQLSLQRFPTGESEYKNNSALASAPVSSKFKDDSNRLSSNDAQINASRTTSTVSSSSARSSSGSTGFKFSKPNLSFKPLLYSQGNDTKSQQNLYKQANSSNLSTPSNGQHNTPDHLTASSPFPPALLSIKLPQSLLNKYVIDQESFRQGKGFWGIGKYSWVVTAISKTNGKKYVIKRVSKALLPPSAYYHYPTTAHQLCTCPACKASRDHLLMTGQLEDHELEKIKEVLVIQNRGNLPQIPPSSPNLQHQKLSSPQRPLSASSVSPPLQNNKEKRRSLNIPVSSATPTPNSPTKTHNRSQSQSNPAASSQNAQSSINNYSPLLPSATPLSWPYKDNELKVPQTANVHFETEPSSFLARPTVQSRSSHSHSQKKRPGLKRHASTPNLSRPITGLRILEDDPSKIGRLKQLSSINRKEWLPGDYKLQHQKASISKEIEVEMRIPGPTLAMTPTMPSLRTVIKANGQESDSEEDTYKQLQCKITKGIERKVDPFDQKDGEFKRMDPETPNFAKPSQPQGFVPPPHALPMELVLLQTYNDSDHLPEHHEWTQDNEFWYYVTKSHGVRRRKLKKVSTWWLDVGSLGNAFLGGNSSHEPIATRPIFDMGHSTGNSTPYPSASPQASEVALSGSGNTTPVNGLTQSNHSRHTPKQSISSITSNDSYTSTVGKRYNSRSNRMGKYYHVDWDEYTSL
ncbi:hypothetical protein BGZ76_010877 [Entomortierella beljakovae]|nr:hypothetical protein BGZ76_010877 [Entomortierella beljakovae]